MAAGRWEAATEARNAGGDATWRDWFVQRDRDAERMAAGTEYHTNARGRLIRYTRAAAQRKAAQLNEQELRLTE
ncbi:hypothetical protein [Mycolicibacterium sphagni]|uniref:hypothetical protein n=1 Tax=Mycolicibacterium sphagni TaxID=1786 RepID=UPI0021F3124C|nr:hypothetical protein [Mycolicibacterium sphagni]MCV7174818.1 hypothetical protein [Mycolicibacterium sphagni]